jgi:hypothetical protein
MRHYGLPEFGQQRSTIRRYRWARFKGVLLGSAIGLLIVLWWFGLLR